VQAIKIEGRQRSPSYVAEVTRVWRAAIDLAAARPRYAVQPAWSGVAVALGRGPAAHAGRLRPALAMKVRTMSANPITCR
jgi:collagenase-like PrtC family protease